MASNRGRPPTKAPGGLTKVLFVRLDERLIKRLDWALDIRRKYEGLLGKAPPSRADLVREILHRALIVGEEGGDGV